MNKILFLIMTVFSAHAAVSAVSGPPTPPPPTPPPGTPIDSSLVVLLFIALILGYYLSNKYITIKKESL